MVKNKRRWLVGLAAAILAVPLSLTAASSAMAGGYANCPHGANYTSSACLDGVVQRSDSVQFHNNTMRANSGALAAGYHVNETIWAYSGSPCGYWVEEGLTLGYHGITTPTWYYAKNNSSGYADYQSNATSFNGTNHTYTLTNVTGQSYNIYRDGNLIAGFGNLGSGTCIGQTGLEISKGSAYPLSDFSTDTFDETPLTWTDTSNAGHTGWNTSQYWIDNPCGSAPNCLNGVFYSSSHFANNKPS